MLDEILKGSENCTDVSSRGIVPSRRSQCTGGERVLPVLEQRSNKCFLYFVQVDKEAEVS